MSEFALENLMCHRDNLEHVLDNLKEGIIAHDMNRRIFFFNQAAGDPPPSVVLQVHALERPPVEPTPEHRLVAHKKVLARCGKQRQMLQVALFSRVTGGRVPR